MSTSGRPVTYILKIWYIKVKKLLHGLKNPLARCWDSRDVGTSKVFIR